MVCKKGMPTRRRAHPLHDIAHERRFSSRMRLSIAAPLPQGQLDRAEPRHRGGSPLANLCTAGYALRFAHYFRHPAVQHYVIVVMEDRTVIQHSRGEGDMLKSRIRARETG